MAHAKGYKNDIFISYARKDDEVIGAGPGWVQAFHESLESWLIKRRGLEHLKIWRDTDQLAGNTSYDSAIENGLEESALFFAMHSRNFVKSDYCQKELEIFHRCHAARPGGLNIGHRHRVFNILLNNIHYDQWMPSLEGTSGFPMHCAKGDELGEFTFRDDGLYMRQLHQIVNAVEETLGLLHSFESGSAPRAVAFPGTKPVLSLGGSVDDPGTADPESPPATESAQVFVADTSDALYNRRERILADLRGEGLSVYDDVPPPMEAELHAARVREIMKQAPLSVHLLDQWPGRRIMDDRSRTYAMEQARVGLESGTPQLIWASPELDLDQIEDEDYRHFLKELEEGVRGEQNYEFVRASLVDFSAIVCEKAATRALEEIAGDREGSILLDTHQKDQRYGFKVADLLAERGIDVQFNQESVDPVQSLDRFEESVRQAKSLMIMCGQVAPEWLMGRIKKAVRVVAEQFDKDDGGVLEDIWVYLLPGATTAPQFNRIPFRIEILDNSRRDSIDPAVMTPFFAAH